MKALVEGGFDLATLHGFGTQFCESAEASIRIPTGKMFFLNEL